MEHLEIGETLKVPHIGGQNRADAMDIHTRRETGVVDLHSLNVVLHQEPAPAFVNFLAIRQEFKIAFDHARQTIGVSNAQPKAIPIQRPGGRVPKFRERL